MKTFNEEKRGRNGEEGRKWRTFGLVLPKVLPLEMEGQDIYSQELPLWNPSSRQQMSLFTLDG